MPPEHLQKQIESFIEKGADIEHTRWANWQKYIHSKLQKDINEPDHFRLPTFYWERWERQINTPYSKLSEAEKESDRSEVRSYLPLLKDALESAYLLGKADCIEEVTKKLEDMYRGQRKIGADMASFQPRVDDMDFGWNDAISAVTLALDDLFTTLKKSNQ